MTAWNQQRAIEAAKRDRQWAADFLGGMTHREIAERDGTTQEYVAKRLSKRLRGAYISEDERIKRLKKGGPGRPQVWADCPDELRADYRRFRFDYRIPAAEARRMLEGAL